jgi:AraC-like DNA-binding protein
MKVIEELDALAIPYKFVDLGMVRTTDELSESMLDQLKKCLLKSGLELLDDKRTSTIEKVKGLILEKIVEDGESSLETYSEYLSESTGYEYSYLSHLFSEVKGMTIQQFIVFHRIERVKELMLYEELSLTEIAYRLKYSSVGHLSNQFRKVTGLTPSFYRELCQKRKILESEF